MKSIVVTYPYFQSLPKGVKMMLIASESFFFAGDKPEHNRLTVSLTQIPQAVFRPTAPIPAPAAVR